MNLVEVKIELGHRAEYRENPTPEGFTHDWVMYIRGVQDRPIHHFVEKVVFYLHESFNKPKRVVREPPFQLKESGYAGFILPIEIYFKNREGQKKVRLDYDLFLHLPGCPPVNHVRCEKLKFHNPTAEMQKKLIKAGGVIVSQTAAGNNKDKTGAAPLSIIKNISSSPHINNTNPNTVPPILNAVQIAQTNSSTNSNHNKFSSNSVMSSTLATANHSEANIIAITTITTSSSSTASAQILKSASLSNKTTSKGTHTGISAGSNMNADLSFTSLFGDPIKPNQQKTSSHTNYNAPTSAGAKKFASSSGHQNATTATNSTISPKKVHPPVTNSSKVVQSGDTVSKSSNNSSKLLKTSETQACSSNINSKHAASPLFDSDDSSDAFDELTSKKLKHKKAKLSSSSKREPIEQTSSPIKSVKSKNTIADGSGTFKSTEVATVTSNAVSLIASANLINAPTEFGSDISSPLSQPPLADETQPQTLFKSDHDVGEPKNSIIDSMFLPEGNVNSANINQRVAAIDENNRTTSVMANDNNIVNVNNNSNEDEEYDEEGDKDDEATNTVANKQAYSPEFVMEMLKLQRDLMGLRDKHYVQRVVDIIVETRKFTISPSTFDFDLCKLDLPTLERIKSIVSLATSLTPHSASNAATIDATPPLL